MVQRQVMPKTAIKMLKTVWEMKSDPINAPAPTTAKSGQMPFPK